MKKLLAFVLCLGATSAFAAGKLSVTQENFHHITGFWNYGYAYAKVENVGDKPIKVNAGVLEMYDENGEVIADPDVAIEHPKDSAARSRALTQQQAERPEYVLKFIEYQENIGNGMPFWWWAYDVKAAFSAEVGPMVAKIESVNFEVAEATFYTYGIPAENEIQYEDALVIGRKVLAEEYGLTDKQIRAHSDLLEAYDVSDPDKPMWKFVFINPDDFYGIRYRVLINGRTGEIILHESYPWQTNFKDEEYDRKLY